MYRNHLEKIRSIRTTINALIVAAFLAGLSAVITLPASVMAAGPPPIFVGTTDNSRVASTSINVNVPAGAAVGDVMIAAVAVDLPVTQTVPSGWTLIGTGFGGNASGPQLTTYYRVVNGTEPGGYSFSWDIPADSHASILLYRGADTRIPIDIAGPIHGDAAGNFYIALPEVTTVENTTVLRVVALDTSSNFNPPTGATERVDIIGNGVSLGVADATQALPNYTNSAVFTSGDTDGDQWATNTIALQPPQVETIQIAKLTDGRDGTFTYTSADGDLSGLSITTNGPIGSSAVFTKTVGSYTITENSLPGWTVNDIRIEGDEDGGSAINVGARQAVIDLDPGEDIVVTFVGYPTTPLTGVITVTKQVDWNGNATDLAMLFDINMSDASGAVTTTQISDGGLSTVTVPVGTYTITETNPGVGWNTTYTVNGVTSNTSAVVEAQNNGTLAPYTIDFFHANTDLQINRAGDERSAAVIGNVLNRATMAATGITFTVAITVTGGPNGASNVPFPTQANPTSEGDWVHQNLAILEPGVDNGVFAHANSGLVLEFEGIVSNTPVTDQHQAYRDDTSEMEVVLTLSDGYQFDNTVFAFHDIDAQLWATDNGSSLCQDPGNIEPELYDCRFSYIDRVTILSDPLSFDYARLGSSQQTINNGEILAYFPDANNNNRVDSLDEWDVSSADASSLVSLSRADAFDEFRFVYDDPGYAWEGDDDPYHDFDSGNQLIVLFVDYFGVVRSGDSQIDIHNTAPAPLLIGNRVWTEDDGNGIYGDDATDVPVVGVTVTAVDGSGTPYTDVTDASGFYTITVPANGTYTVTVPTQAGTTPSTVVFPGTDSAPNANNDENHDAAGAVVTVTTEDNLTIDFGFTPDVVAQPLVAVGNFVWNDLNNNGILNAGIGESGIDGVEVQLFQGTTISGSPFMTMTTAGGGFYLFDNLTPGDYVVHIPASEFAASGPLNGYASSAPEGIDNTSDDNADENGQNTLGNGGISSTLINLTAGNEPPSEGGAGTYSGSLTDENVNMTVDFGFVPPLGTPTIQVDKQFNGVGDYRVGETISFTIRITNTGNLTITTLPLEDRYSHAFITYQSAVPAHTAATDGIVTWTDLLANDGDGLGIDESVSVDVFFTTTADTTLLPAVAPCTQSGHAPNLARSVGATAGAVSVIQDDDDTSCDSVQILNPTGILLAQRSISQASDGVLVRWSTVSEMDVVGFHIWQANGVDTQQRSSEMILAQKAGLSSGASYSWVDENRTLQRGDTYILEIVHKDGSTERIVIDVMTGGAIFLPIVMQ